MLYEVITISGSECTLGLDVQSSPMRISCPGRSTAFRSSLFLFSTEAGRITSYNVCYTKLLRGYPITPQNDIPEFLSSAMCEAGGQFVQAESEVAAANMLLGAAAAGIRAMTSSSSPGMSLKQEAISYMAGFV